MYKTTTPKIALREVIEHNKSKSAQLPAKLTAVIVGGTSGIGEHISYKFAQYIKEPTIYLLGRNENAASEVIRRLKEINGSEGARYEFIKTDVSLLSQDDRAVKQILEKDPKVNSLILSAGILGNGVRNETAEGLDVKMSTHYYGRWRLVAGLLPALEKSATAGEPTAVVSVLGPDSLELSYPEDIELKDHYSSSNVRSHTTAMNTYAVDRFSKKYPGIMFAHLSPGFVRTNWSQHLPWYMRYPAIGLTRLIADDPSCIAERVAYISLTKNDLFPKGKPWIVQRSLRLVDPGVLSQATEDKLWAHTEEVFERVNGLNNK